MYIKLQKRNKGVSKTSGNQRRTLTVQFFNSAKDEIDRVSGELTNYFQSRGYKTSMTVDVAATRTYLLSIEPVGDYSNETYSEDTLMFLKEKSYTVEMQS